MYLERMLKGSLVYFIALVFASGFAYLTRLTLLHNLSQAEFGLFYATLTFISLFLMFRNIGMYHAFVKFIPEYVIKKQYGKIKSAIFFIFISQTLLSVIFISVIWYLSPFLAESYFKDPSSLWILRILSLYFFTSILFKLTGAYFRGFQNNFVAALIEPVKNLIILLSLISLSYFGFGIFSAVWSYVLVGIVMLFIFYYPAIKTHNLINDKMSDFRKVSSRIIAFGIPVFSVGLGGKFISYFDTLMLTYFGTLEQVGVYNIILPTALLFMIVVSSISSVFMPMVSELWTRKKYDKVRTAMRLSYRYIFLFGLPFLLSFVIFSDVIIRLLFGEEYLFGNIPFKILLLGIIFNFLLEINKSYLVGIGRPKNVFNIVLFGAVMNIVLNLILIPPLNILGAAIATSVSYLSMSVYSSNFVKDSLSMKLPIKSWMMACIGSLVFLGVIYGTKSLLTQNVWVEIFVGLSMGYTVYLIIMNSFGLLNFREIKHLINSALK
ncbi:flippase [Candidatus Woesearchaeota archaeon]|jgi:O-antigen/teichoic acid export membrane protein|nr:flippase [Candidatus Woesearchaeota archaeon]MBT6023068.1 flippase [Candidatus Woesearchaeota archaeon]